MNAQSPEEPAHAVHSIDIGPGRMISFSDGVLAVIITITALGIRPPNGTSISALGHRMPGLLIYALSFTMIGIYWNNHHHLLRATHHVSGRVMWANLHLLFWLSLIPIVTEWVGADSHEALPAATFGAVAFVASIAYAILFRMLKLTDHQFALEVASWGRDFKANGSSLLYAIGIALAFLPFGPWLAYACFVTVAAIWFIPDRRLNPSGVHELR